MSPDNNAFNDYKYKGTHFSELLAEKLGYELIVYAKPGSSNGGICVQIEEAIRSKPDLIIFGQTVADRIEFKVAENPKEFSGVITYIHCLMRRITIPTLHIGCMRTLYVTV
jgi:hypothetical protein